MAETKNKFWTTVLVTLLALLILGPIGALYFFSAGAVSGEEFCPDDFTRRRFQYNVVPWFDYPLRGLAHSTTTTVLEQTLVSDGLIKPRPVKTWDLIYDSVSPRTSVDFDARFLTDYLDLQTKDGDFVWIVWNTDNPNSCKIFWPAIAELARNGLYLEIPKIMRHALNSDKDDADQLQQFLDQSLGQAFCDEALAVQAGGDHTTAVTLFSKSLTHQATRNAYQGRAQSYAELGESGKSKSDLDDAKAL